MKVILPNAMRCGCGYELFWRMNPRKLESFYEAYKIEIKERATMQDSFAWLQGAYIRDAILSVIDKNIRYPKEPLGTNREFYDDEQETEGRETQGRMSDGQRFALYMVNHNKALQEKRGKATTNA